MVVEIGSGRAERGGAEKIRKITSGDLIAYNRIIFHQTI